jgi:hypothetical protein
MKLNEASPTKICFFFGLILLTNEFLEIYKDFKLFRKKEPTHILPKTDPDPFYY